MWKKLVRGVIGGLIALAVLYAAGAACLLFRWESLHPVAAFGVVGIALFLGIAVMSRLGKPGRGVPNPERGEPSHDPSA
jgi:hypothetical protein